MLLFLLNVAVEDSLWNTTLRVIIMQGQLDVICNTAGAYREYRSSGHSDSFHKNCCHVSINDINNLRYGNIYKLPLKLLQCYF